MDTEVIRKKTWRVWRPPMLPINGKPPKPLDIPTMKKNIEKLERMKIFWLKEIKHPDNRLKYKPNQPLSYIDWAKELGLSPWYMWAATAKNPKIKWIRIKIMKDLWKEMQDNANEIISDTLNRKAKWANRMDLKDVDRARFALDFKKATDKIYNPTSNIDVNFKELDITSYESMKEQIAQEFNLK